VRPRTQRWLENILIPQRHPRHRKRECAPIAALGHQIEKLVGGIDGVTGVTWVEGELWHGTWENDQSDIRRIDSENDRVLERLAMPAGTGVSGLESDGADLFYAGGGSIGLLRAVRRPRKARAQ
jgi:hypothetical protein